MSGEQLEQINGGIQMREPAPGLSSVTITDLALDERNEIHIEVTIMGTARSGSILCWSNGIQCVDNIKESLIITNGNKVVGEKRYFHTGIYYSESVIGQIIKAKAQATNAMQPWNKISTSRNFTIPRVDL